MSARLEPIAQLSQRATEALVRELGVMDALRFLGQFRVGSGIYTTQRKGSFHGESVHELAGQIRYSGQLGPSAASSN